MKGCRAVRSHHLLVALQLEQRGGARGENSEAGACGREDEPRLARESSRWRSIAEERNRRALVARQHEVGAGGEKGEKVLWTGGRGGGKQGRHGGWCAAAAAAAAAASGRKLSSDGSLKLLHAFDTGGGNT